MKFSNFISVTSKLFLSILLFGFSLSSMAQKDMDGDMQKKKMKKMKQMKQMAPAKGYIKAHKDVKKPYDLLGGPVKTTIVQDGGGVFVALPDQRELDKRVFGTPEHPMKFAGTPGATGVPLMVREKENGKFTKMKKKSPFGDKHIVLPNGNLMLKATDKTATDAATTDDEVQMEASWEDGDGNTYTIKCCEKLASHGMEFPTYGGVATNIILHGFTGNGTPLMPSEFTYMAFWGMGAVIKNGELLEKPRLVHGMLTEYVRKEGYKLALDHEVTPGRRHFHLMVAPFMPDMENMSFKKSPVNTGFKLPNGMELPFWHVMFENLDINSNK